MATKQMFASIFGWISLYHGYHVGASTWQQCRLEFNRYAVGVSHCGQNFNNYNKDHSFVQTDP